MRAPDHAAGRRAKCPKCGDKLTVPIASSPAREQSDTPWRKSADDPERQALPALVQPTASGSTPCDPAKVSRRAAKKPQRVATTVFYSSVAVCVAVIVIPLALWLGKPGATRSQSTESLEEWSKRFDEEWYKKPAREVVEKWLTGLKEGRGHDGGGF
jgi:hypothetical protein